MGDWKPIDQAPKDRPVLLFGRLMLDGPGITADHPRGPIRVVGYWSRLDDAWALTSAPWVGPFCRPSLWAELPSLPHESFAGEAQ